MTKSLDESGLSAPDKKLLNDVRKFGWHTTGVFARQGEQGPEWAFSIGLFHSFAHPEILLFGLPLERCIEVVNVIGAEVKAGRHYEPNHDYRDILQDPYRCAFKDVHRSHYRDHVGCALWFYEDSNFPLLQCFWPDKQGLFPWEDGCNEYVKRAQPLLFKAANGHNE